MDAMKETASEERQLGERSTLPGAPALRFRVATRKDTPRIVALLNETFRTPIDQPTWEWFAHGNPLGSSRIYLAVSEQTRSIVGTFGFAPICLRMRGTSIAAAYAHHLVLNPAHRDGMSFVALSTHALREEASRGVQLVVGPPNTQAYRVHKTLMKWVDFGFLDCLRKASPSAQKHDCQEVTQFPEQFDLFYGRIAQPLTFCLEKNAPWMNWRFCGRPGSPYTVYAIANGDEWAGYVVLKRWQEPNGYRKGHILDLHAIDEEALSQLTAAAESYAAGCQELNLWAVRGYVYRDLLEARGFTSGSAPRQPFIGRAFDGCAPIFPDGKASLSYGDGDSQY
jgi:hypothetical protein